MASKRDPGTSVEIAGSGLGWPTLRLALLLLLLAPGVVLATGPRTWGLGARSVALGGAMAAHVDDHTSTFYNPAGLVVRRIQEFTIGVQFLDVDVSASNPSPIPPGSVRDSDAFPVSDSLGLHGGMRFLIPLADALEDRVGFGLSFFTGLPRPVDVSVPFGFVPQYALLIGQTDLIVNQPALAFRLLDGLSAGVGATIAADVGGDLEIPTGVRGADGVDEARTVVDQEVQPIIRGTVGVRVDGELVSEELRGFSLGVTWRDQFSLPLQIPVAVFLGPIPLNIGITSDFLWTPMQAVLGLAYRTDDWLVAGDLSWNQWSAYDPATLELALDVVIPVVSIDLKDAINSDPGTRDTYSARLGAEWRAYGDDTVDLWIRGGYAFEPSPFPEQTGITTFLDGDRHLLSAGLGLSLSEPPVVGDLGADLHLDLAVQWNLIESTTHRKDRVNPLFEVDDNDLAFPPIEDAAGNPIADPAFPVIEGEANAVLVLFTIRTTYGGDE